MSIRILYSRIFHKIKLKMNLGCRLGIRMEIFMSVNCQKTKKMEEGNIIITTGIDMKDSGKEIEKREKEDLI